MLMDGRVSVVNSPKADHPEKTVSMKFLYPKHSPESLKPFLNGSPVNQVASHTEHLGLILLHFL